MRLLARELERQTGYRHELSAIPDEQMEEYLRDKLAEVPVEMFITSGAERKHEVEV
jgi:hypothetical protein